MRDGHSFRFNIWLWTGVNLMEIKIWGGPTDEGYSYDSLTVSADFERYCEEDNDDCHGE